MSFKTKTDLSNNRQVKKRQNSVLELPGVTNFGNDQGDLITGADLDTVRVLIPSTQNVTSSFTGNTNTGIYTYSFGIDDMADGEHLIQHFTLSSQEGEQQMIGPVWIGLDPIMNNGVQVYTRYTAVQFDLTLAEIVDLGNGNVSGSTRSTYEKLEADPLDYDGDFVWVNVRGITRTKGLIIEQLGVGPSTADVGLDADGKAVNVASDERLKENIEPLVGALEKVLGLQGVTYQWKDRKAGTDAVRIGFIAQQVRDVVPELVHGIPGSDYLSVYYSETVPLIIEAIKELVADKETYLSKETREVNVEIVYSEDNSIELNFNGTHETSKSGGIIVKKGVDEETDSELLIDDNGDWELLPNLKIKNYTPTSSEDIQGNPGNLSVDDNYLYVRTSDGWKRIALQNF